MSRSQDLTIFFYFCKDNDDDKTDCVTPCACAQGNNDDNKTDFFIPCTCMWDKEQINADHIGHLILTTVLCISYRERNKVNNIMWVCIPYSYEYAHIL